MCQYDAIVIAEQPGVSILFSAHQVPQLSILMQLLASDLRTLSQTSYISTRLTGAASSLQIPYISHSGSDSLDEFKRTFTDRCGARRVELDLGQGGIDLQKGVKHVVCVSMPHLEGESTERKGVMGDYGAFRCVAAVYFASNTVCVRVATLG